MKTIIVVPDTHVPAHDKKALTLLNKVASALNPWGLVIMGDWVDMSGCSRHPKTGHEKAIIDETRPARLELARLVKSARPSKKWFLIGNHEKRIFDYTENVAPAFRGAVTLESLLGLEGWGVVPYQEILYLGKLGLTHDQSYSGANAHIQTQALVGGNVLHGHNHRLAISYRGNPLGERWVGGACGFLGDSTNPAFSYANPGQRASWQLGFVIVREHNGISHVQPVPIVNYTCVVDGVQYRA